jgi:exosortase/archaeosortase family protein
MKRLEQKDTFKLILAALAIIMILLPPFAVLNSALTKALNKAEWYRPIQKYIVPWETRLVAATIAPLGIESKVTSDPKAAFYMVKEGMAIPVDLSWNCLGWQSVLLLVISLVAGLRGSYTNFSRVKCVLFGLLGTLLINVFRMSFIAAGIYYVNSLFGMIVHDYFAAFITILWLGGFWWFSYSYILQHQIEKGERWINAS